MPSFTVSLSMRSTFTMILPSMMMLSFSLRERMSITSGNGVEDRWCGVDRDDVRSVKVLRVVRVERGDEPLHEVKRAAEQRLILLRALAHTHEQFVVFLNKGGEQRLVILWQEGNEMGKTGVRGLI